MNAFALSRGVVIYHPTDRAGNLKENVVVIRDVNTSEHVAIGFDFAPEHSLVVPKLFSGLELRSGVLFMPEFEHSKLEEIEAQLKQPSIQVAIDEQDLDEEEEIFSESEMKLTYLDGFNNAFVAANDEEQGKKIAQNVLALLPCHNPDCPVHGDLVTTTMNNLENLAAYFVQQKAEAQAQAQPPVFTISIDPEKMIEQLKQRAQARRQADVAAEAQPQTAQEKPVQTTVAPQRASHRSIPVKRAKNAVAKKSAAKSVASKKAGRR